MELELESEESEIELESELESELGGGMEEDSSHESQLEETSTGGETEGGEPDATQ